MVTPQADLSELLHHFNTRYEWLVRSCSTGTFTLQETPSFSWRTNGLRYRLMGGKTILGFSRRLKSHDLARPLEVLLGV
jgi:hypothetical protein